VPELPDIEAYLAALRPRAVGNEIQSIRIAGIAFLKSFDPPIDDTRGAKITGLRRMGKRIVFELNDDRFLVLHLMVAGRLLWKDPGAKVPGKIGLGAIDFEGGSLIITEAGTKKRASLYLVAGEESLTQFERGGLEVMTASAQEFAKALRRERHTLKRALTDPTIFSGIGGAFSDEIMHRAKLSPMARSDTLNDEAAQRLFNAVRDVLGEWTDRLSTEVEDEFPTKVTAFRPEMAVHGKFGEPCPVCDAPVQRIVYASNETNYCPGCQTEGRILADRSLSRILKDDWPKSLEELEG